MAERSQQQRIADLEKEVQELRKILISLKYFVGQEDQEEYIPIVKPLTFTNIELSIKVS